MAGSWNEWEGQVINGEFHLQKYLGSSDHSVVFLTDYRGRGPQQAVIKLVPADAAQAELLFSHWRLGEGLFHPNLLQVSHKGRCQLGTAETAFIVVEYAEENLAQIVPGRPLTPAEALEMLEPVLDVLAFLHQQGLAHGGLKPANIMAANDKLKLSCDSLCKPGEQAADHGKRSAYDPPEKGSAGASPAGDMWLLGMTLVEVLTQRLPSAQEQESENGVLPKDSPAALVDIVRGCLHHNPAERWTIARVRERLHPPAVPAPEPIVVQEAAKPEEKPPEKPKPPAKQMPAIPPPVNAKRQLPVMAVVVVVAVAAILIALGIWHRQTSSGQGDSTEKTEKIQQQAKLEKADTDTQNTAIKPSPASPQAEQPVKVNRGSGDEVLYPILPKMAENARESIQGTVRVSVKVQVDPSGRVVGSQLDSAGPSPYFARLALDAAPQWRFKQSEQSSQREFVLRFEFRGSGVKASARPAAQ